MPRIEDLFSTVGDVEHSRSEAIPKSAIGSKVGVFVMASEQQASDCADRFHGHVLDGYSLSVRFRNLTDNHTDQTGKGLRMAKEKCQNLNHGRSNASVRHCPNCGDIVNNQSSRKCDDIIHANRRKDRNNYCCDCGKKLRT